ncbi:hypothetical protein KBB96_04905 [Luteolibacter ambystomatis]|uniref:Uncharacterized protein n=1 Tax=Luteolibacter ambystomatis TaxID=2824561 RepID=A0A975J1G0_9BACT|nr:hypothetical protein [Luteolibacter ambystomatis]QUE52232.1 hypothetical protein KBB96_04905 [Luteolibacter ambystomatis]
MNLREISNLRDQILDALTTSSDNPADAFLLPANGSEFLVEPSEAAPSLCSVLNPHFRFLQSSRNSSLLGVGITTTAPEDYKLLLVPNGTPRSLKAAEAISRIFSELTIIQVLRNFHLYIPDSFRRGPFSSKPLLANRRPLILGCEIDAEGELGSLGGFVRCPAGRIELLSCQHVFGALMGCLGGKHVSQPKTRYSTQNRVAITNPSIELSEVDLNFGEAASARFTQAEFAGRNEIPRGQGYPFEGSKIILPPEDFELHQGTPVFKIGKTTGFTRGSVFAPDFSFPVTFKPSRRRTKKFWFDGGFSVVPEGSSRFSYDGDSGALIFCESPVPNILWGLGLISAGGVNRIGQTRRSTPITFACSLRRSLSLINRTWVE